MSKTIDIRVPDIGDFVKVPVIEILVAPGDAIEAEQSLITLESDKATMEVPAPHSGTLVALTVAEGDELSEGDVIGQMTVADDGAVEDQSATAPEADEPPAAETPAAVAPEPSSPSMPPKAEASTPEDASVPAQPMPGLAVAASELPHASPAVRKMARELGIALSGVVGTGRHGRITDEDLTAQIKSQMAGSGLGLGMAPAPAPVVDFQQFGEIETVPLSRIQKISGPALHRNWVSIPHVTQTNEADITEMEAFRQAHKAQAEASGTKLTPVVFLIKAVVASLRAFPQFNASLSSDGQQLIQKRYFHIGVAVDTPGGLVVPVLRDCDQKGLLALAEELGELSVRAREGKLSAEEMKGGCFTISSLGGIGGGVFTPIINAPELAILGVSKAQMKPHWNGDSFEPRLMLPLSLSYDHRVIDGADAARFVTHLSAQLEDLRRLLM